MAKRVRVTDDGGTTWYTLPGNTAERSAETGDLDDTIYGQDFESTQSGLIGWTINANGLYKGFAGYLATIMKQGTPTAMTDEAMSVVTGKTYQVTTAGKRMFDRNAALTFKHDSGTTIAASDIESVNYLFGRVTFVSGFTPTGSVTVTGNYLPLAAVGCANEFTLNQTANANDVTCMDTAQANNGHRIYEYGLKTVSLDLTGIYKTANGFLDLLKSRAELIIEVNPDGNDKAVARGYFKPSTTGQSGDVGDVEEETITFNLSVPEEADMIYPFGWLIASDATLNMGIQKVINAWQNKTLIRVAYLADGVTGHEGDAVVTDLTLTGGLEAMNTFAFTFQGTDEEEMYS
jgi:hypothetical protein